MKTSYTLLAVAALLLACLVPAPLNAKGPKGPKAKATPPEQFHTVIASISGDSITVQTSSASKTYKITQFTSISYCGQTVKAADLKSGMRVEVSTGSDPTVASRVAASGGVAKK